MATNSHTKQLRLRVFAGPNGSGKTTIIQSVKNAIINGQKIDFGIYINADDIASALIKNSFSFNSYKIKPTHRDIVLFAETSGLLNDKFDKKYLQQNFKLSQNKVKLVRTEAYQQIAQLLARYLREQMLKTRKRFTFETVFSHPSNLDIMRRASEAGYKVYLYFVSTESPEINKFRVRFRVIQKGHDVSDEKIEARYYRSLDLLYEAAELAYQCFFFDNSIDDKPYILVNHFKRTGDKKIWDSLKSKEFSKWFIKYYWNKLK
ncbi:MAG: zeta toxin family protein [Agriterribacter sp.]